MHWNDDRLWRGSPLLVFMLAYGLIATGRAGALFPERGIRALPLLAASYRRSQPVHSILHNMAPSLHRRSHPTTTLRGGDKSTLFSSTSTLAHGTNTPAKTTAIFFDNAPLWQAHRVFVGANFLGLVINLVAPTLHYHVDLIGTGAFAVASLAAYARADPSMKKMASPRLPTSFLAVVMWSTKLAGYLFYRVLVQGHDARLDSILSEPTSAVGFWTISALWGILCSLPHVLGATSSSPGSPLFLAGGALIYGVGLVTETLADYQKWSFKQSHPGQFCNVGLWTISQHPNWLGNLLLWSGILIMNAPALIEPPPLASSVLKPQPWWSPLWRYRRLGLALLGPLFLWTVFRAQATGVIAGETLMANRLKYGYTKDPVYTAYIDDTPLIVPNPLVWFL